MSAASTVPPPASDPGSAPPPHDSSAALQEKLAEFLKTPAVLAGGALVVGLALARLVGTSPLRAAALRFFTNNAKSATPDSAETPRPAFDLEKFLPELQDRAKKMLAEFLTKKE